MKTIFIMAMVLAVTKFGYAQTEIEQPVVDVPEAVKDSFKNAYPEAKSVNWDRTNDAYEASFKTGEMKYKVTYDGAARVQSTEKPITVKEIPQACVDYMKTKHPNIEKYQQISEIKDAKGNVAYEIEASGKTYHFDKNCNLVRTEDE